MLAWFDGDFERCLTTCDGIRTRDARTHVHTALLRARAYLRLSRPDDALSALRSIGSTPCGADEVLTTQMLTADAHVRRGEPLRGLAILARARAVAEQAHATIRSEILLNVGLAEYRLGRFDAADKTLRSIPPQTDIVYARVLECLAWTAHARGDDERAASMFIRALETFDACAQRDRFIEANCVRGLAHLALERLDESTWRFVEIRRRRIDWSASGLDAAAFWTAYCAATYSAEVHGAFDIATREARLAESIAPTLPSRIQALCKRASVLHCAGEPVAHADHLQHAVDLAKQAAAAPLVGDDRVVPLILAEQLALGRDVGAARASLASYREFGANTPTPSQSPSHKAYEHFVEASVAEAAGDADAASREYQRAFATYAKVGYTRRAAQIALRVHALTGDRKMIAYADRVTAHLPSTSYLRGRVAAALAREPQLTDVQREVLALICQGKSNPEIARLRKRSLHTIRNLVARLFEVLDVKSREELAVEGVRLGVYAPERRSIAS